MFDLKSILIFIFGNNQRERFHRIVIFILLMLLMFAMTLNISCGWDNVKGFYFGWKPVDVKVELKK